MPASPVFKILMICKGRYDVMCAWKAHEHIEFNFVDFQVDEAINSQAPYYIKSVCGEGPYVLALPRRDS